MDIKTCVILVSQEGPGAEDIPAHVCSNSSTSGQSRALEPQLQTHLLQGRTRAVKILQGFCCQACSMHKAILELLNCGSVLGVLSLHITCAALEPLNFGSIRASGPLVMFSSSAMHTSAADV